MIYYEHNEENKLRSDFRTYNIKVKKELEYNSERGKMMLADKIIELRKKLGWSQEQLAEQLEVSRQSVSKWESGMSIPDIDKIVKMSGLFGVSTDYLLREDISVIEPVEELQGDSDIHRSVSMEEAITFMDLMKAISGRMAAAISLFIISSIPLFILCGIAEAGKINEDFASGLGVIIILLCVIVGVAQLILIGMKTQKYEYLEKEQIVLQYGVQSVVEKRKEEFADFYGKSVALGVVLCIAAAIPLMVAGMFSAPESVELASLCLLVLMVACAVYIFVKYGTIQGSFQKLLQEGDYEVSKKKANKKLAPVIGAYWCIPTAIFLAWSFLADAWEISWVVWPVAGVLFAAFYGIMSIVLKD